jgi:hypothetical protein
MHHLKFKFTGFFFSFLGNVSVTPGRQQESSKNVFRVEMTIIFSFATHFLNFLLQYVVIIIDLECHLVATIKH